MVVVVVVVAVVAVAVAAGLPQSHQNPLQQLPPWALPCCCSHCCPLAQQHYPLLRLPPSGGAPL